MSNNYPIEENGSYICGYLKENGERCERKVAESAEEWNVCWQHQTDNAELGQELIDFMKSLERYALADPTKQTISNKLDELERRGVIDSR